MRILVLLLALAAPACAQRESDEFEGTPAVLRMGGLLIYHDTKAPMSFAAMTPKDLPPGAILTGEVRGRACQHGLAVPLSATFRATTISGAKGDGGYEKALQVLAKAHPELSGVFDVKVDLHTRSILGFYRRLCTEVSALGFRLP